MGLLKFGVLSLKLDPSSLLGIKVQLMMFSSMPMGPKFSHVGMIDKLEFGRTQCKLIVI